MLRNRVAKNGTILHEKDFRDEAARERVRADRNGLPLAILVIELAPDRYTKHDVAFLSRVLDRRLRITDTAGFLGDGRIAVLLPDTPKAGAWKVASDICDLYPVGRNRPNCEVYIYPDDSLATDDRQKRTKQSTPSAVVRNDHVDALFVYPASIVRRTFDVLGALTGLILAFPILLLMGLLIKLTSPGPVFFAQWREGKGGRRFRMYKLRSMFADADQHQAALRQFSVQDGPAFKMSRDPRTTWIGRLLRRCSLDELPQLWNVLIGDMSLVGPRPLPVDESLQCAPWHRRRLTVAPGLTCIWQVRGRSTVSFEDWMRMDLAYLRRRSFSHDVGLLLSTIPSLVLPKGPR